MFTRCQFLQIFFQRIQASVKSNEAPHSEKRNQQTLSRIITFFLSNQCRWNLGPPDPLYRSLVIWGPSSTQISMEYRAPPNKGAVSKT